jgi:hypothetical protein
VTEANRQLTFSFLPTYEVRVSRRARHLQLRVLPPGRVEVVVPKGVALKHVPGFVAEHEEWLRDTLASSVWEQTSPVTSPEEISLAAITEVWRVEYASGQRGRIAVRDANAGRGVIQVTADSDAQRFSLLQAWLTRRAKAILIPWLSALSREIALPFTSVSVRAQRSCWGSCSNRQHISLNRALLFLDPEIVRYLLIHELCHTVHLNHSRRYWNLVERFAPHHRDHETSLGRAMADLVPRWAFAAEAREG